VLITTINFRNRVNCTSEFTSITQVTRNRENPTFRSLACEGEDEQMREEERVEAAAMMSPRRGRLYRTRMRAMDGVCVGPVRGEDSAISTEAAGNGAGRGSHGDRSGTGSGRADGEVGDNEYFTYAPLDICIKTPKSGVYM
jgi:hypothetical protein